MKVNFITYIFIAAFFSITLSSCDDYLDVNEDPNRVTAVSLDALLPTTIEATSSAHYSSARQACQVSQQIASYFNYPEIFTMDGTWSTIYLKALNNLDHLVKQAEADDSPHYAGVAKVLQAVNIGLLADNWEAVPYGEAFEGADNFTPAYDNQEKLYTTINSLLDDAILDLQSTSSLFSPAGDDLAFAGDLAKWIKLAYTLKARYAMHLSNKGGSVATDVLTALEKGMLSNDDDFQLTYNATNKNPWHTNVALANATGNLSVAPASYIVAIMSATADGDPRLSLYADTTGTGASVYVGLNAFDENALTNTVDFSTATWHSTESAPILMTTFAEAKFLEAEAALMAGDKGRAYTAYLAGIAASMDKLGVDASAYMAHADVAVGADNITLADIMREKYIALYLHTESWVDMRRHAFSSSIYPDFEVPVVGPLTAAIQRVRYPDTEFDRNNANATANSKDASEKMWRDQ